MSKKRAFVRYSKQGKIVPGSLILTAGSHPNGPSTWKEVPADLCCDNSCIDVSEIAFFAYLRYYTQPCDFNNKPNGNYYIKACDGKLRISTDPIDFVPVPDGYYFFTGMSIQYVVENSIIIDITPMCP